MYLNSCEDIDTKKRKNKKPSQKPLENNFTWKLLAWKQDETNEKMSIKANAYAHTTHISVCGCSWIISDSLTISNNKTRGNNGEQNWHFYWHKRHISFLKYFMLLFLIFFIDLFLFEVTKYIIDGNRHTRELFYSLKAKKAPESQSYSREAVWWWWWGW